MKVLLLNQAFYPDVASTAQHLTDLALRLVEQGHQVTVVTGRRAYDDPRLLFPKRETWQGIQIIRVASTVFGKGAAWHRAADFASFIVACVFRLAFLPGHDRVVALTTPPLISFIGAWLARLWRASFFYWVMDFNPDEAIAVGWLRAGSMSAKLLDAMSRFSLHRADKVIALDRFMRDRIMAKGIPDAKVVVIPPWSHDSEVRFDPAGREKFRAAHGLANKFVVMYSGNHSPVHPLDTLLAAAERLQNDPGIVFCFVGGGSEWRKIEEKQKAESRKQRAEVGDPSTINSPLSTIQCLPYQPLDQLAGSLSAADVHVVVMGDAMVGLVHPCKIYNILSVGAPILYIGPEPSHVTEILARAGGQQLWGAARHGEVERVVAHIQRIRQAGLERTGHEFDRLAAEFSKESCLPRLLAVLESKVRGRGSDKPAS